MMKKILIAVVALAIVGGGIGFYMSQKGHDETADVEAAFSLSADAIVQEFLDDEAAASAKYIDQVIEVSGPVFEIVKADGHISGVKISSDEFAIVNCTFQSSPEAMTEGEIKIKGVCSGFIGDSESMLPGGTVELKRGALVK
jgi:hypothetical protein